MTRNPIARYTRWLHTRWPAGTVEPSPRVNDDGSTDVTGLYVVGDLTGVPLLKFSADTGARAAARIADELRGDRRTTAKDADYDLVIIGGGVSGHAAALSAKKHGLTFTLLEATEAFSTIVNFPKGKPIYTYPTEMTPAGDLRFRDAVHPKEQLLNDLYARTTVQGIKPEIARAQRVERVRETFWVHLERPANRAGIIRCRAVIVAIGRSGNFRRLNVPGEDRDKVYNRLHDPKDYAGKDVLVVGGGDSALETAIAVAEAGGRVTLSYRKPEFSRPKPENVERVNRGTGGSPVRDRSTGEPPVPITILLGSQVRSIGDADVTITDASGKDLTLPNDVVFTMVGREPPLDFLRRSGVKINGDRGAWWWTTLLAFLAFCVVMYHWKGGGSEWPLTATFKSNGWFPFNVPTWFDALGATIKQWAWTPTNLLFTLKTSMADPAFYYTLAYCLCVVVFGVRRIRRRRTPYVTWQTVTLMVIQCVPLFLLPQIILPWAGRNGLFDDGAMRWVADQLFEVDPWNQKVGWDFATNTQIDPLGPERAWWRAYGLVLAWPLFIYNVFTDAPMWGWLVISFLQTFVAIPAMIYFWGKGAYCGWICSCGALAETLGDAHRHKMPHGPVWNRLNMLGQAILAVALLLLVLRVGGWIWTDSVFTSAYKTILSGVPFLNYKWFVDLLLAGILGVGLYFHFSGRVWCRFACPLAALMHVYARFSRFRILADKKRCISCNVCTSVCHQGIDVMSFANKGLPMADPQCVRCSACVQQCPTGVLSFGQVDRRTEAPIKTDPSWLAASPVLMREIHVNGKRIDLTAARS